jgi:Calcineurin-like phosphoesterase
MRPAAAGSAGTLRNRRLRLIGLGAAAIAAVPFCDSPAAAQSQVMLRPAAGVAGTVVQVTGRGFPAGRRVTVEAGQRRLAVRSANDRGNFTARIRMPASPTRLRLVSFTGKVRVVSIFRKGHEANRMNVGEVDSSTGRRVRWSPLHALPGAAIRLRGSRFRPGERVAVSLARKITRRRPTRRGSFAAIMTAPARAGRYVGTVRTPGSSLRLAVTVARGWSWPFPPPGPLLGAGAVIAGAGDIAASNLNAERTAKLLDEIQPDVVYTTGDNAYPSGAAADYARFYEPTWGRHKAITRPTPGNHDYQQSGAGPYFDYFGPLAGDRASGYYAYTLGSWRLYALNSNIPMKAGSPQETWLREDLAANRPACVLAYWHHPRFSAGKYHDDDKSDAIWRALYDANAELVLNGHDHNYQRYAPLSPAGGVEEGRGIREFVVGTGGMEHYRLAGRADATRQAADDTTFGVLKLTLSRDAYQWQFVPEPGMGFTDTGSGACH